MYLAILCVSVTSAGTAARVHVCHSHMQIVMPAACDSFAPVLLLLRQDGPQQSRLHVVCVRAGGGGGGGGGVLLPLRQSGFKLGSEKHTTEVTVKKSGSLLINSGIQGYSLLKTTQSGFEGFVRDRYTLLPETRERIVATEVTAWWSR
uniref:factor independent urate hydroxylase n=1 Tax=Triticum urartu TaxID=4572 RepID=A0A8R7QA30_TRIUA